ncbi:MAG: acylphosphatase [Phycisphaerae bacterium]|jgi:acylphosphatase
MSGTSETGPVRRRVVYSGRVQGVFFRATSTDLARGFAVTGYVRNRRDGAVELEAEGPPDQVSAFLDAIARHFHANIISADIENQPARGDETDFQVRY